MHKNQYPYPYLIPMFPYPFWVNPQMYNMSLNNFMENSQMHSSNLERPYIELKDYGPNPFVVDIGDATDQNTTFRTILWTGDNLQVSLMSIPVGGDIGLEIHETVDQFIRIEEGQGIVKMGDNKDNLDFQRKIYDDSAILVPAGKWQNIINTGNEPLKLYTIYSPPQHPSGTVNQTKPSDENSRRRYRY